MLGSTTYLQLYGKNHPVDFITDENKNTINKDYSGQWVLKLGSTITDMKTERLFRNNFLCLLVNNIPIT